VSAPISNGAVRLPVSDWLLLAAVAIVGTIAGTLADPRLYAATPLALFLVYGSAARHARAREASDLYAHPDLPLRARRAVEQAAEQLPTGDARTLLVRVVTQAVLFFQAHQTSVGELADDNGMLADVTELVESACASAEQLALLDAATEPTGSADSPARGKFTESLTSAAGVIRNLHLAIVGGGTVASERLTEISEDLREEADARSSALAELASLLEQRRKA
jgi:hypothetical protein